MATNALRIVIINDDPEDLALLRRHLVDGSERTLTVIETSTGEEGIRACLTPASPRPDCVIVDLHLPDMGCLELLNRLKNSKGMVLLPIVLLIDSGEECKAATDALRAGAQDYIAKSWLTADGLSCVVEHAIERFEILRRLRKKRKRVKNALKEADKRKDEFLARLAHELRNPLAAIRTATHILRMKGPDEPDQNWGRDVIERQVKHLTRLIDDLLDVSRISTGKVQLKRAPLDVREIVSRSVEAVSSFMTAKQHELRLELPTEPLATHADPARLEQVLCNLLTNAAKYTDHGGAISLSGEREGLNIVIRIKDNGVGIAPEKLGRVFSLFTQIDSNLDRPQGGLGMGLTLVKMLVEMHEGRVTATSGGPGLGSEFTITLPALLESTRPAPELGPRNASDLRTSSGRPRA